jgi:hypothetical protein
LQTFDAELFLQMNQKKPQWTCPVCNKDALYDNLIIDGYFSELIKSDRLPEDEHEVVLNEDGSWQPLPPKDQNVQNIAGTSQECVPIEDSDPETSRSATGEENGNTAPVPNRGIKRPFLENECITLDSDSDTEEPDAKKALVSPNRPGTPEYDSDIVVIESEFD